MRIAQTIGNAVKPGVNRAVIHLKIRNTFFIEKRCNGLIFHRPLHGISMDDRAKFIGGFIFFQQRRAGECHKGGIRQRQFHPHMVFATLTAVPFINQDDNIGAGINAFRQFCR
ncbi:Uncharacterised protein [Klebsiella pneumoniae]|nr:Uncharacterised protein [Klebsiella pneumoniae]